MSSSSDVFIVSAARTPIGSFQGAFNNVPAHELGAVVLKEVVKRANIPASDVDEVILGQALQAGQGQNPARQASLKAGLAIETPAYCINMLCGSGLKSIGLGVQAIKCGDSKIVIAGGQENMSKSPHVLVSRDFSMVFSKILIVLLLEQHLRGGTKMGSATMIDTMLVDGLTDAMYNIHMGETAENLAQQYQINRQQQDEFAAQSQNLAENAQNEGKFLEEIVSVPVQVRKDTVTVDKDEYLKHGTTVDGLGKLRACFIKDGTVTPGNASGINDSAAAVLLASGDEVQKRNLKPLAKVVAFVQTGCEPKIMGAGKI